MSKKRVYRLHKKVIEKATVWLKQMWKSGIIPQKLSTLENLDFIEKKVMHQVIHNIHMWITQKKVEKQVSSSNVRFVVIDKIGLGIEKKRNCT